VISRWAGHRKVLCPVVFLGGADEAEQVAEGWPDGMAGTGEGVGSRHLSPLIRPSPCVSSCGNFPIRARQSRFVLFCVPKSCGRANRRVDNNLKC